MGLGKHKCALCGESCGGMMSLALLLEAVRCPGCDRICCEACANKANPGSLVNRCPACQGSLEVSFG